MNIEQILNIATDKKIILSIIVIIIMIIAINVSKKIFKKGISKNSNNKKKNTYVTLVNNIIKYIIIVLGIMCILQINGINVSSIIAGLGIASVITGLALQDALKDIIMGFNIIVDNYFSVGDIIKIDKIEGKVISFGLKSTKIRDIDNGNIFIIANRNIDRAIVVSGQFDIDISLPYKEDIKKIEDIIESIVKKSKESNNIKDIQYMGIQEFSDPTIKYKLRIWCNSEERSNVKRNINRIIKVTLEENNI